MRNFLSRDKREDGKPEVVTAVDDAADHTSIEKDIVKSDGDFEKEVIGAESVTTATRTEEVEYVSGWKLWSLLVGISSVFILVLLDMAIVATAVPVITSKFNSLHDVGWYGSSYLLASAALQPLTGKMYARFNTKWTFIAFFALFEFGSLICGAATSSMMLIIGRAIAGMGGSGLINGGMQIIYQAVPAQRRPGIMGVLMAISQIGLVGGPLLGGVLTEFVSWRWCFYINLPVGAVSFVCLAFLNIPDQKHRPEQKHDGTRKGKIQAFIHSLDLKGFTLFAGFSVMVILALVWGGVDYAWNSPTIIGLLIGGGCTLVVFCWQEYRIGDRAMFPWSVVKITAVWCSSISMFLFFGSQMCGNYYLPIFFQVVQNASPAMSGVYTLPSIFGTMFTAVLTGVGVSRFGYYVPFMLVSGVLAGIGNGLLSTMDIHTPSVEWAWWQLITGFGRGCGMQMPIIAIQTVLPPPKVPAGSALIIFQQTFGGAFFLAVAQTLFNTSLEKALKEFAPLVDAQKVIDAGAAEVRDVVSGVDLTNVLRAYNEAISHEFYLAAALSSLTVFSALGMGWVRVAPKQAKKEKDSASVDAAKLETKTEAA